MAECHGCVIRAPRVSEHGRHGRGTRHWRASRQWHPGGPTSATTSGSASVLAQHAERITAEGRYRIPSLLLIDNACDFGHGTVKFVVGDEVVVAAVVTGEADFAVGFGEAFGLLLL